MRGYVEGIYLESVVRYLDDISQTYEVIDFEKKNMGLYLFFYNGSLNDVDDYTGGEGITLIDILKENGLEIVGKDDVGKDGVEMLRHAIKEMKGNYYDIFNLLLKKIKN